MHINYTKERKRERKGRNNGENISYIVTYLLLNIAIRKTQNILRQTFINTSAKFKFCQLRYHDVILLKTYLKF